MKIRILKQGTDHRSRYLVQRRFFGFWITLKLYYSGTTVSFCTTIFGNLADAKKALEGCLNDKKHQKELKKDKRIKEIVMKAEYK